MRRAATPGQAARRAGWAAVASVPLLFAAAPAHAAPELQARRTEPTELSVTWRRFGAWDYVATGVILGALLTVETQLEIPAPAKWTAPLPILDVPVRNAVVLSTREGRENAGKWSDVFWYFSTSYPVVDALATPVIRGAPFDVIWQLQLMNAQAFALSSLITRFQHRTVGRARPNLRGCQSDPNYDEQCGTLGQLASFPSGHTSISMTGAGLSCAHHLYGKLYGNPVADGVACAVPLLTANIVSLLRLQADRHWISDNIAGTLIGFPIGFGLPALLYYRPFWRSAAEPHTATRPSLAPRVAITPLVLDDAAFIYAIGVL